MKLQMNAVLDRLSAMPPSNPIKRLLRTPLYLIPPRLTVAVVDGPLQGKLWIVGSSIHGCWLGTYDRPESTLMKQRLRPGSICFDIGAQAGYHTLYAASLVGPAGRVFAFEPAPRNIGNLLKHLAMNRLANVSIIEAAVSDSDGVSHFDCAGSPISGHLSAEGGLTVRTISLDREIDSHSLPEPDYIKIDAEGAELKILQGARRLLARRYPTLSVETHQWLPGFPTIRQDCAQFLIRLGYTVSDPNPYEKNSDTHLYASRVS